MKKLFSMETECNVKYYPKCNSIYNDDTCKGYARMLIDYRSDGVVLDSDLYISPQSNISDVCDVCGAATLCIYSIGMYCLVCSMASIGIVIKELTDIIELNMYGVQRLKYSNNSHIVFSVPDKIKSVFESMVDSMYFINKYPNGDYVADLCNGNDKCLRANIDKIGVEKNMIEWLNEYAVKIISDLVSKGYSVNGAGMNEDNKKYTVFVVSTGRIERGFHVYTDIYVTNTSISFDLPPRLPDYLEWVESLPEFEEA